LKDKLRQIKELIDKAAIGCGRDPASIRLVAVSKTVALERVEEAIEAGITDLGENYVQEAREKIHHLSSYPVSWHFIGHLQTNKAKYAVRLFDLIHSVDSLKLAKELDKQAKKYAKIQPILIQVNVAEEASKSGVSVENTRQLITGIQSLNNLALRGLMTMPPYFYAPEKVRPYFKALRLLRDKIETEGIARESIPELSMGMTGDFEVAIQEGATIVRVGTAIFGERN
jgi:pyridoxal phosphate enzyme (YggS family)